jgi:hypothetical protein
MVSKSKPMPEIKMTGPMAVCRMGTSSLTESGGIYFHRCKFGTGKAKNKLTDDTDKHGWKIGTQKSDENSESCFVPSPDNFTTKVLLFYYHLI